MKESEDLLESSEYEVSYGVELWDCVQLLNKTTLNRS